ncbi:MAG: hypothetical protein XD80_1883, partial [Synergistales bacterium 53_16]
MCRAVGIVLFIGQSKHRIGQPAAEPFIVAELLKELGVILEQRGHHTSEGLVVLDAGVLLVGILAGILVGGVGRDPCRNLLGDQFAHPIGVGPENVAELIVK